MLTPTKANETQQMDDMSEESINTLGDIRLQIVKASMLLGASLARMRQVLQKHPDNTMLDNATADIELSTEAVWHGLERIQELRQAWGSFEDAQPTKNMRMAVQALPG